MLVIGSRGSQLALWQARWIQGRLAELGWQSRIEVIHTTGDKILDVALSKVGGKGLFTKEIEEALLAGDIDLAVHSAKDMPADLPPGLAIAAIPEREDPHDALVGSTLADLPRGARLGTSSLRRAAQLRAIRPDLQIETIRGNVDTRLRKLDEDQFAAIMLAAAGLRRLGWSARIAELLKPEILCPAAGQGALAVETRQDGESHDVCSALNHPATSVAVLAERALLKRLGGSCQIPIGAFATLEENTLRLQAVVAAPDGGAVYRAQGEIDAGSAGLLAERLAQQLLDAGAREVLENLVPQTGPPVELAT